MRTLPHDREAFTQGLAVRDGCLFESTGLETGSSLRRLDLADGSLLDLVPVVGDFAEGLAVHGDRVYQLTWSSGRVLVYDRDTLRLVGEQKRTGEGWGLAAGAGGLYATDGSPRVSRIDPEPRWRVVGSISAISNVLAMTLA